MEKKKILIIDDEEDMRAFVGMRLQAAGYEILTAIDGMDGLNMARAHHPNLIILDVMMPKMDGFQVCRMLKFDEIFQDIPVIMLTAKSQPDDKKIGQDVKADAYITKPFEGEVLIRKVKEFLN